MNEHLVGISSDYSKQAETTRRNRPPACRTAAAGGPGLSLGWTLESLGERTRTCRPQPEARAPASAGESAPLYRAVAQYNGTRVFGLGRNFKLTLVPASVSLRLALS